MRSATKYRNTPCEWAGNRYRSKRERDRHQELLLLEKAGKIVDLRREVPYELASGVKFTGRRASPPLRYVADFVYEDATKIHGDSLVVEDCKGVRTQAYRIKRHLMLALLGIEVVET